MNNNGGRYPPGIVPGRGGNMSGSPNPNPNLYGRNSQHHQHHQHQQHHHQLQHQMQQQYVQRNPIHNQQQNQHQYQHQQQQQQWMRRNQMGSDDGPAKQAQSSAVGSSSQDWKTQLKIPPRDNRYQTEVKQR